jgi:hypothetical protein
VRQFVQRLVEMFHAQWLYRNFTLHHHVKGYLRQRTVKEICREVELLTNTQLLDVPQGSRYLLEVPQLQLPSSSPVQNVYWVLAMKAAKTKLRRKEEDQAKQGTRSGQGEKQPSHNLLERVQESLYSCLLLRVRGTKRKLAKAQALATARSAHQQQRGPILLFRQVSKPNQHVVIPNHLPPCKQAWQENPTLQESSTGPH